MAKRQKDEQQDDVPVEGKDLSVSILKSLMGQFNKNGEDKVAWNLAKDQDNPTDVKEFISTGSTLLDYIISNRRNGGVPVGKFTEISGQEASGKSLLAAHILANAQKRGAVAVLIDTENACNPDFMSRVGVDLTKLLYLQPGTVEKCFEAIEKCISVARARKDFKSPVVIVWDSVAATPPQAEIEGDYDPNSRMGLLAKALAKGLRKLGDTVGKDRITVVFTNQLKQNPGAGPYQDPWVTPGGKAIPYHASVRVRLTQSTKIKDEENEVKAIKTNARCIKTRLGPPLRTTHFEIHFDHGVDDVNSLLTFLHEQTSEVRKNNGFFVMENVPRTREDGTGVTEVVPELKFRQKGWYNLFVENPAFHEYVMGLLDKHLIKRYDGPSSPVDDGDDDAADEPQLPTVDDRESLDPSLD